MSTISAIPDDQTYLKPKKSASSNLKLIVAGAAVRTLRSTCSTRANPFLAS